MSTSSAEKARLIQSLIEDVSKLPYRDDHKVDALMKRARMIITRVFGERSRYLGDLDQVDFFPVVYYEDMPESAYQGSWTSGKARFENLCKTMLEDLHLTRFDELEQSREPAKPEVKKSAVSNLAAVCSECNRPPRIFVVHGHENEMKLSVARTLEKLGFEPIILHEQPDKGRTVIEKFLDYSDVGFAVVCLSPDDMAYAKGSPPGKARPRARQNVVLELGFFLGKLGRDRVVALHKEVEGFETPSDYAGVLFKPYDDAGHWCLELVKELAECGYKVDANKLIK